MCGPLVKTCFSIETGARSARYTIIYDHWKHDHLRSLGTQQFGNAIIYDHWEHDKNLGTQHFGNTIIGNTTIWERGANKNGQTKMGTVGRRRDDDEAMGRDEAVGPDARRR